MPAPPTPTGAPWAIAQTAYDPTGTMRLLDLLADTGVAATFCWVGRAAEERPDLVQRAVADGHEVAAHSWEHRRYADMSADEQRADVERTLATLSRIARARPVGHKTPGRRYDAHTFPLLQQLGVT